MPNEISTVQSLKAVDAWIDVINANINGGVRTAFKSSRLKFGGTNSNLVRAGTSTSLPLQFPEPGLMTANSVVDFTQGAITASTENTHLAIQGDGFYLVASPAVVNTTAGASFGRTLAPSAQSTFLITRDGEFHTNQNGFLVTSYGYYLMSFGYAAAPQGIHYDSVRFDTTSGLRAVYNDMDNPSALPAGSYIPLTNFVANVSGAPTELKDNNGAFIVATTTNAALFRVTGGKQSLQYSSFGSTVFDIGYKNVANVGVTTNVSANLTINIGTTSDATILTKSLEASNASMTQSVPELSLAQKLFSALTKILQTSQTNTDSVLNLVR